MNQEVKRDYFQAFSPVDIQKMRQVVEILNQTPKRNQKVRSSSNMDIETPEK